MTPPSRVARIARHLGVGHVDAADREIELAAAPPASRASATPTASAASPMHDLVDRRRAGARSPRPPRRARRRRRAPAPARRAAALREQARLAAAAEDEHARARLGQARAPAAPRRRRRARPARPTPADRPACAPPGARREQHRLPVARRPGGAWDRPTRCDRSRAASASARRASPRDRPCAARPAATSARPAPRRRARRGRAACRPSRSPGCAACRASRTVSQDLRARRRPAPPSARSWRESMLSRSTSSSELVVEDAVEVVVEPPRRLRQASRAAR